MSEAANEQIIAEKIEYLDGPPIIEEQEEENEGHQGEDGDEELDQGEEGVGEDSGESEPHEGEESTENTGDHEAKTSIETTDNNKETSQQNEQQEQDTEEQTFAEFSERAGVAPIKSEDELIERLQKLEKYEKGEIEFTPKFKSEAQKKAYETIINAQEGNEFKEAARIVNFLAKDFSSMSEKDLLKQAFIEDHKEDYTEEEASKLFERKFSKQYQLDTDNDDPDDIEVSRLELKKDANTARRKLTELQNQLKSPKQEEQVVDQSSEKAKADEKQRQYLSQVEEAFKDLSGEDLEVAVSDKADENFIFKFENMDQVKDYSLNTTKFFGRYIDDKGVINWDKYKTEMGVLVNLETYTRSLINHGRTLGKIESDTSLKNPSTRTQSTPMPKAQVKTEGQQIAEEWAKI